ncbi:MAG: glycosyltransferase family 2 protein [Phycisphaerales bacterium]|nr:glycosyltransferase family 2 protein [Phycisphaerales bacterium]
MSEPRTLVAMPVFNEAPTLERVLRCVRRFSDDLLVVNDGSTDGSEAILRAQRDISVIHHPENRGYGQSLIDAFEFAARRGFDWVITIDCDEQHEPARIPDFLTAIREDDADLISGSRYLNDHANDDDAPPDRRRINRTITEVLRILLDLRVTDSFCGFKAHRVSALRRLSLTEPGYAFPLQFWPQCVRAGLRVREIPVRRIYHDASRSFGETLDNPAARLQHYLEVLLTELRVDRTALEPVLSCCVSCLND